MAAASPFADQIKARLHGSLCGLREGEGLAWLTRTLKRLDDTNEPGLQQIVHSFVSLMHKSDAAQGFLLELRVADVLLNMAGPGNVFGNRQDGAACSPCDVTMEFNGVRVDVQCKAILNMSNEIHVDAFKQWIERRFSDMSPGMSVEMECNTAANEQTFGDLKNHLRVNMSPNYIGKQCTFTDRTGSGTVRLRFEISDVQGVRVGAVWSSSDIIGVAQQVDVDDDRATVLKRIQLARKTFGFRPSATQHNLVAITLPSMAFLHRSQLPDALYGQHFFRMGPGVFEEGFDKSGLFFTESVDHCSGIMHVRYPSWDLYDNAIYPHPGHDAAVRSFWSGKDEFRVASHPNTNGQLEE